MPRAEGQSAVYSYSQLVGLREEGRFGGGMMCVW